jgi:hypothetical protein
MSGNLKRVKENISFAATVHEKGLPENNGS